MKSIVLSALALSLAVPSLATSMRNPYDFSTEEVREVLSAASTVLFKKGERLESLERTNGGWELKTAHCTLDVQVEYRARLYPLPSPQTHWLIQLGECR